MLEEKATLDRSDAEAAALESVGGGSISEVELDEESGFLVWDVEVQFEGSEHEVAVDAGNGRITPQRGSGESLPDPFAL